MLGRFLGFSVLLPFVLGVAVVLLGVLLDHHRLHRPGPDPLDLSRARPGDCLTPATAGRTDWRWGSCADPRAGGQIRAILTTGECIDIPGADSSRRFSETFCLGDRTADPAASVNGITAGECTTADGTSRQDCGTPGHRVVLAVLEHQVARQDSATTPDPDAEAAGFPACARAGAEHTDTVVNRSLVQHEGASLLADQGRWARSLCLSPVR